MIETLEDIIEDIANKIGIYGLHEHKPILNNCQCRLCFTSDLRMRILQAVEIENKLRGKK